MKAIISYGDGRRTEAVVAMLGRFTMRVIVRGRGDTIELRSEYGQWMDETGAPVEFDALVAGEAEAWSMPAAHGASFEVM